MSGSFALEIFAATSALYYAVAFAVALGVARLWHPRAWTVAAVYAGVVVLLGAAAILRIYVPATAEDGAFFMPYFFAGGPLAFVASGGLAVCTMRALPNLMERSAMFWIVVVPGVFHVLIGGAQWWGLAWVAGKVVGWWEGGTKAAREDGDGGGA